METPQLSDAVVQFSEKSDSDLYLYSGPITGDGANQLISAILLHGSRRPKAGVILTTYGGSPDAAYRIARFVQDNYSQFRLLIAGPCKSSGTLVATGADELAFSITGEIGPLDIQLAKPDEIGNLSSGLDALRAYTDLSDYCYNTFERYLLETLNRSQGLISTKTAAEFACNLIAHLVPPIASQIDPYRLAEVGRAMSVAMDYGYRLDRGNLRLFGLDRLVNRYPSHGFVIDAKEATEIFHNTEAMTSEEYDVVIAIGTDASWPSNKPLVRDLVAESKKLLTGAQSPGYTEKEAPDSQASQEQPSEGSDAPETKGGSGGDSESTKSSREPTSGESEAEGAGEEDASSREAESEGPSAPASGVNAGELEGRTG